MLEELARQDMSLAEKIVNFLKDLMQRLQSAFAGVDARSAEAKAIAGYAKELQEIWDKALKSAVEGGTATKNTAEDGGGKYSIRNTKNMTWEDQINGLLCEKRTIQRNDTLVLGHVGKNLLDEGVSDKLLAIPLRVVTKAMSGKDISHSIKRRKIAKLKNGIENAPLVVVNPERNAIVYVTNVTQGGAPLLAAFDMNAIFDGDDVHKATSIHLQMDVNMMLENLPETATVYVQKKDELTAVGATNSLRGLAANVKFIDQTVPQRTPGVKGQNSLREVYDVDVISRAEEMEREGKSRKEIWKATGLVQDAMGIWVAEIDDSAMKVFPRGDALLAKDPDYQRYIELANQGDFFSEEYRTLREKFKANNGKKTLEQFVQHDELFRYFPALRDVEFIFRDLGGETRGYWSASANAIVLDESLKKPVNGRELSRTAIHEIQHAMQHLDRRAGGSSVAYWEGKIKEGYRRGKNDERIRKADAEYRRLFDSAPEDIKRVVREINREKLAGNFEKARGLADSVKGTEHEEAFLKIDDADFTRRLLRDYNAPMTAKQLYKNTAGEIEARSAGKRLLMTAEQRRENMPDLEWDYAVFATGRYSLRDSEITDREILAATLDSSA